MIDGYIDDQIIRSSFIDALCLLCGPELLVDDLREVLARTGLGEIA